MNISKILAIACAILFVAAAFMYYQNKALTAEKKELKSDLQKKEQTIKEYEKINELYIEVEKENERYREVLNDDHSDNLDVAPATYILNRMHKD